MRCNGTNMIQCKNGGICCEPLLDSPQSSQHCVCPVLRNPPFCGEYKLDFFEALSSMQESNMRIFGLAATIGLTIAVLALIALTVIIVLFVRKSQQRKAWRETQKRNMDDLSRSISVVQREIGKLPKADKLNHLTRLTKLVEVSCLAGGSVILKNPYAPLVSPRPSHACLPRWSSAPGLVGEPKDVVDGDLITKEKRKQLQQVFSVPDDCIHDLNFV